MSDSDKATLMIFGVWIICLIGWIVNAVKLIIHGLDDLTTLTVLRIVGLFVPPLGTILGFF